MALAFSPMSPDADTAPPVVPAENPELTPSAA
jgi:hypothetical protein